VVEDHSSKRKGKSLDKYRDMSLFEPDASVSQTPPDPYMKKV